MRTRFTRLVLGVVLLAGFALVAPHGAAARPGESVLRAGEVLASGEQVTSPDGRYLLRMQGDGNVVLYGPSGAAWASRTSIPGTRLVMQGDGNLVAYTPADVAVWSSRSSGAGARLVLQDDGNAVVYDGSDRPLWATATGVQQAPPTELAPGARLTPGERLSTTGGRHILVMQDDGNLVLYGPGGPTWASRTSSPGASVVMQSDGNLVAYSTSGAPVWQSRTGGNAGARAVLQSDGNFVVYRPDGLPAWYPSSPVPAGADIGPATQVIGTSVATATATSGTLTAWTLGRTGWSVALAARTAWVGSAGVGQAREGLARTPAGTFGISSGFGRAANPGTGLPYRMIDGQDWWISDTSSSSYNQYARCAPGACPFNEAAGENLYAQGTVYQYAAVIDYNLSRTPGAGSAIFLHVSNGRPTAACVAIDQDGLVTLLRWLSPSANPIIYIGTV